MLHFCKGVVVYTLPVQIVHPALVGKGSAFVGCARDDLRVLLVANIVDGDGVFVVAVANVAAIVLGVRASVDDTLSLERFERSAGETWEILMLEEQRNSRRGRNHPGHRIQGKQGCWGPQD